MTARRRTDGRSQTWNGLRRSPRIGEDAQIEALVDRWHHGQGQEEGEGSGRENQGRFRVGHLAEVDGHQRGSFLAAQQLRLGHVAIDGVGRIVEGELIAQAPTKDTEAQHHQAKGEAAQASASTEGKALLLFR